MDWKMFFEEGWATIDDLREAVMLEEITEEEFEDITGEDYE